MFKTIAKEFSYAPNDVIPPKEIRSLTGEDVRFICRMVISEMLELASTVTDGPVKFVKECAEEADLPKKYTGTTEIEKIAAQADAFVDTCYYIGDTSAKIMGVNLDPVFEIVHQANRNKIGENGNVIRRNDGKLMKPPGWKEPDVVPVIKSQIENGSW